MQDDLKERLRATRYTERWPGFCTDRAINPDGPEAADRIAALEATAAAFSAAAQTRLDMVKALEAKLAEKDALLRECGAVITDAMFWDSHDEEGVAAVWLEEANETLAKIKDATDG